MIHGLSSLCGPSCLIKLPDSSEEKCVKKCETGDVFGAVLRALCFDGRVPPIGFGSPPILTTPGSLRPNSCLGELALLYNCPRAASVEAKDRRKGAILAMP